MLTRYRAPLLTLPRDPKTLSPGAACHFFAARDGGKEMVAPDGFEPPTKGL